MKVRLCSWLLAAILAASTALSQPTLTPSSVSVPPETAITLAVAQGPGNPTDWVGLFQVGAKSQYPIAWSYLNGAQTPPTAGLAGATLAFTMPHRPTNYEFRFFANGGTAPTTTSTWVLVQSPPPPPATTTPLPFDPLPYETYNSQTRKVVAHHHNFTVKQDNLDGNDPNEWWNRAITDGFDSVGGDPGDGGGVRSRPYPLPSISTYQVSRWKPELQYYKDAGVDILFVNMQPLTGGGGTRRDRVVEALDAAEEIGGIKIAMNLDYDGGTDAVAAAAWARDNLFNRAAYAKAPNGRCYVGAFLAGSLAAEQTWHKTFINACETQGTPAAYVPTANFDRNAMRNAFSSLGTDKFPGYGGWGNARSINADASGEADTAWANGNRFYLWPDRPQQYRIKDSTYLWDETAGPRQFINIFTRAAAYKTPADPLWVQLVTGTDQFEGTGVWPTTSANFLWMDLTAWFGHALKLGAYPAIVRDGLMYCHRSQHHTLRGHSDRHSWTFPWNVGVPAESNIYAVVFPTADSTVEITLGSRTESFAVPGGVMSVVWTPFTAAESGRPIFRLIRNAAPVVEITSNYPIVTSIPFTDPEYKAGSSLRPGTYADTIAPHLTPPANLVLEATGPTGAVAIFSATAHDFVDGDIPVQFSPASGSTFPLGTTTVTATATDAAGNTASGSFTVTVRDTTAPQINGLVASPASLWPPNHKMMPVTIAANVSDAADPAPVTRIVAVSCNETTDPANWEITGSLTVKLRAERNGGGTDRIYTITVESRDASGNASTQTATVTVPHDQGN